MKLDLTALESCLWEAACAIRGPVDALKFKDYILPLIFLKGVSDVFEDEIRHMEAEFETRQKALKLADADHELVHSFVPEKARWAEVAKQTKGVGEYLTDAVRASRASSTSPTSTLRHQANGCPTMTASRRWSKSSASTALASTWSRTRPLASACRSSRGTPIIIINLCRQRLVTLEPPIEHDPTPSFSASSE
jgi:hypothetical protein